VRVRGPRRQHRGGAIARRGRGLAAAAAPADRLDRADAERAEQAARAVLGDSKFDEVCCAGAARPEAVLDDADQVPARR
jgi:hypothetical protein